MINEKDFVPSGLFGGEPDERRIGFFTKIVELISKSTASKNLYQETSDAIPVNSVLLSDNLQTFPDSLATPKVEATPATTTAPAQPRPGVVVVDPWDDLPF